MGHNKINPLKKKHSNLINEIKERGINLYV